MADILQMKKEISDAAQKLFHMGQVQLTNGNVSMYDEESGKIVITPTNCALEDMTLDDLVVIDPEGRKLEGEMDPSSEWKLHTVIYKRLPGVKAIIHSHAPFASAFAVNNQEIPVVLDNMVERFNGVIEVAPYALQGSTQLGLNALPILKRKNACLLANHGAVSVGKTMKEAFYNAEYLEEVARIYFMACSIGKPVILDKYKEE